MKPSSFPAGISSSTGSSRRTDTRPAAAQKLDELPDPEKLPPLLPYPVVLPPPPRALLTLLTPVLKPELKVGTEKK